MFPAAEFDREEEVLLPSASAALYRRSMLEEIGLFDEDFFLYCEDTDLGLRARWAGWKCIYVPEAVVDHHYSHSAGRASRLKAYYVERNRLFVVAKNFPARMLWAVPFATLARYWWHARIDRFGTRDSGPVSPGREQRRARLALIAIRAHWKLCAKCALPLAEAPGHQEPRQALCRRVPAAARSTLDPCAESGGVMTARNTAGEASDPDSGLQ